MAFGLSEASLISAFVESVLFGLFTVLYAVSVYVLRNRCQKRVDTLALIVSTVMFILGIAHLSVSLHRVVVALIEEGGVTGGANAYLGEVANKTFVLQTALYQAQTLIGDAFITYRMYTVWAKDWKIIVPALLFWLGSLATAIGGQLILKDINPTSFTYASSIRNWPVAFFCLTLATNVSCTVLLAYRIWRIEKKMTIGFKSKGLSPVMIVIIESGAIYSTFLIVLIATYESESWSQYIFYDAVPQVIGFVFTLIIVRIGLGISVQESSSHSSSTFTSGSVKQISVRMTRIRHTRDDHNRIIDVHIPNQTQVLKSKSLLENNNRDTDAENGKLSTQRMVDIGATEPDV